MKAAVYSDYAAPVEIRDIAKPELKDSSVLIEVHAASLNPIDNILRAGYLREMLDLSFPHVMGYDVSGTVVAVGKDVQSIKVGDEVFARPNQEDAGAIAELARVQEGELAIKPAGLSHEEAASIPLAGLTAWQALVTKGKIKEGDKVLIHAGSGGVGTLAIQIAKHFGAFVATTTSAKNAESGQSARRGSGRRLHDPELRRRSVGIRSGHRHDWRRNPGALFRVLKKGGTIVSVKGQDTEGLAEKYGVRFEWFFMSPDGEMLAELARLIAEGTIKTVIDSIFPMDQAADAYDRLATGRAVGKVVVTVK